MRAIKINRGLKQLLIRFSISLFVVFAVGYFIYLYPSQSTNHTISSHVNDIQNLDQSLQKATERLKNLALPNTVPTAKPGAKAYYSQLAAAQGSFSSTEPKIPSVINKKDNLQAAKFDRIILNPDYRQAVQNSTVTLGADEAFISHQAKVMFALVNLIQYDPRTDLNSNDNQILYQHLSATQAGLKKTLDRLKAADTYKPDQSMNRLNQVVADLQTSAQSLSDKINKPDSNAEKELFIRQVNDSQEQLLNNRTDFWGNFKPQLLSITDKTEKTLLFYLIQLEHL